MAVITSKQITMPLRVYRWYKYSVETEIITTDEIPAEQLILWETEWCSGCNIDDSGAWSSYSFGGSTSHPGHVNGTSSTLTFTETHSAGELSLTVEACVYDDSVEYEQISTDTIDIEFDYDTTFTIESEYKYTEESDERCKHDIDISITANKPVREILATPVTKYYKGDTSYGMVESTNPDAYPDAGHQDGYWYVRV